ncbi:hypothetical protein AQUCO_04200003v1 [Aquilegia coerulea]|uniref:Uncharacterized protein n=1 Tax=Aquilegia coerulea TaxID=218851 RepID=A0A2G5CNV3_AQUCA|nr:hypothetical protein AQUCO_04200003v1 [Aquilegia coerulea]
MEGTKCNVIDVSSKTVKILALLPSVLFASYHLLRNLVFLQRLQMSMGMDILFVHISHPLGAETIIFCERNKDHPKLASGQSQKDN